MEKKKCAICKTNPPRGGSVMCQKCSDKADGKSTHTQPAQSERLCKKCKNKIDGGGYKYCTKCYNEIYPPPVRHYKKGGISEKVIKVLDKAAAETVGRIEDTDEKILRILVACGIITKKQIKAIKEVL